MARPREVPSEAQTALTVNCSESQQSYSLSVPIECSQCTYGRLEGIRNELEELISARGSADLHARSSIHSGGLINDQ